MANFQSYRIGQENAPDHDLLKHFLQGKDPSEVSFESREQMVAAMSEPLYSEPGPRGDAYRQAVAYGVMGMERNGITVASTAESRAAAQQEEWKKREDAECLNEEIMQLFGSELYQTSAIERRRVRQLIEANADKIDPAIADRVRINPGKTQRVSVQFGPGAYEEVRAGIQREREEQAKAEAKEAAANVEAYYSKKSFDVTGGMDE
jgi:hypothetical protein